MDQYHFNKKATVLLDKNFLPAKKAADDFKLKIMKTQEVKPLIIAIEKPNGSVSSCETYVCTSNNKWLERSSYFVERLIKFMLWSFGGTKIYIAGSNNISDSIKSIYSSKGLRKFDYEFMEKIYDTPVEVISCEMHEIPSTISNQEKIGSNIDGYRVGFDLGASDIKISAVIDGKAIFSQEIDWQPRENFNPDYHKKFIRDAINLAASKLPKLEAIGGSSAGVYIDNQPRVASIFRGVEKENYGIILNLFNSLAEEYKVPFVVINDGEVSALAGAMSLQKNNILGLALGSSLAVGYINTEGMITDFLNELAFAPIDYNSKAPIDEWSGDLGVGASYLSQQAVFKLAKNIDLAIPEDLFLAERLRYVQDLLENGDKNVEKIWETIGNYLGHSLAFYIDFYNCKNILLLGRVTSGRGGTIIIDKINHVWKDNYPKLLEEINVFLPDEKSRRVGQAIAAASLPLINR